MEDPEEIEELELLPPRFWRWNLLTVLVVPLTVLIWAVGIGTIIFRTMHPWWYCLLWTGCVAALTALGYAAVYGRRRLVRIGAVTAAACVLLGALTALWRYLTVTRYHKVCGEVYWYDYRPFNPDTRAVKIAAAPVFRIAGDPPRMSAAHVLYPLCAGVAQALFPPRNYGGDWLAAHNSDSLYEMLLNGEVDLIFAMPPDENQLAQAKARGLVYRVTPFARDAFVFFVNKRNPVAELSVDQIRGIYSGKITRWEDLGAGSGKIKPFQHNPGNCSQVMMERVMSGIPLMPPLKEDRLSGMGGTISDVADYRNYPGALGYSFRFFVSGAARSEDIKLLPIGGVAPTDENIRGGSYPFATDCCIVTAQPRDSNILKIVSFLRSPDGCELIRKTGYIPLAK